jgi:hypothetical protein
MHPLPDQPANLEPGAGIAVSVTDCSSEYRAEQTDPQSIPAGELVTAPDPLPVFVTTSSGYLTTSTVTPVEL